MIYIIIACVILFILFAVICVNASDFGESADTLTDEEYEETCKAYNEYWKSGGRL